MSDEWSGWLPDDGMLKGQVALVAGGAGGIGAAVSRIFSAAGAAVVVVDQDQTRAEALATDLGGGGALALAADLRDSDQCAAVVERAAAELGGLDIVANIAGGMHAHAQWRPLKEWTNQAWDTIVTLNLHYPFWIARAAIPHLEARGGGAIVNIGSVAAMFGSHNQSAYGAAKAALVQLTKSLAEECGPAGIRVNAVSPGVTLTPAAQATLTEPARDGLTAVTPLRQLGHPEDIARAVLFFASPMAHHITGQMLPVDGGVSVTFPYPGLAH